MRFAALAATAAVVALHALGARAATGALSGRPIVVDDFESSAAWSAVPASGVEMKLTSEPGPHGNALRVDFDFKGGGGYAVLHRKASLDLDPNYRFEFRIRGETRPQNLELKLLDESGENVWWSNRVLHEYPRAWSTDRIRKRQISFAWGPKGGGELRHAAAIELAITAGSGGKGTVWFDDLVYVPLPVPGVPPAPVASASSATPGHDAAFAADTLAATWWESAASDAAPALTLDLGTSREFGGLVLDWLPGQHARDYDVAFDDGDGTWRTLREVRGSDGGRDWLDLPESETRRIQIRARARAGDRVALAGARVMPLEWSASPERFLMAVARESPRGHYPRAFLDEQVYWTVAGQDADPDEGLLDEDGRLETGRGQFSLEPFLITEQGLRTWADGESRQELDERAFPVPAVTRLVDSLSLRIRVMARAYGQSSQLVAEYTTVNLAHRPRRITLCVALRPFQVNPPSQALNLPGGAATIDSMQKEGDRVIVNGERAVGWWSCRPASFAGMAFDEGDLVAALAGGRVPERDRVADPRGRASGVLSWTLDLGVAQGYETFLVVPFHGREIGPGPHCGAEHDPVIDGLADAMAGWGRRLGSLEFSAGGPGRDVAATLEAQLGFVLVNRDGPAIQPGSRSYERSWIRDGSLTSTALLRAGMTAPVREFLEWYAGHQYADGKVPCCVDRRGADPVPEHDSHGELVYLAAEYLRLTGDTATARRVYPHVRAAVAYLDTLRAQRRTPEWRTHANAPYFGLLPPSISHEGYSAKPMHSYWDDLFALRGYRDGAWLAQRLGQAEDARWMAASGEEFAHDFAAAAAAAMRVHGIDYLPGCSDLGDFDATSTTVALEPVQAEGVLPERALRATFERYWTFFQSRRDGREKWDAYTPYEMRNIGAFVRLGWRERANELLEWFMRDRRPAGWKQWAEVVDHDPRHARFIGDMPHTWVGTDFARSVLDMLAYERERDTALVVAAGVPASWLADSGVAVRGLHTRWGTLGYRLTGTAPRRDLRSGAIAFDATDLRLPPGGIVLELPTVAKGRTDVMVELADGSTRRMTVPTGPFAWKPGPGAAPPPKRIIWAPHVWAPHVVDEPIRNRYR